jgi:hypothetical protein
MSTTSTAARPRVHAARSTISASFEASSAVRSASASVPPTLTTSAMIFRTAASPASAATEAGSARCRHRSGASALGNPDRRPAALVGAVGGRPNTGRREGIDDSVLAGGAHGRRSPTRARTDHHRHRAAHPPGSASVTIASTPCSKPCSVRLLLATGFQQPRSARPGRRATRHTQRNQRQPSRLRPTPAPRPQAHHPHPRKPTATDSATSVASTPCCSPTSTAACYAPGLANSSTPARQRPADSAPQPRTTNGPRRPHPASRTRITKTRLDLADFADPSFASATPAPDRRRGPVGPATARILQR